VLGGGLEARKDETRDVLSCLFFRNRWRMFKIVWLNSGIKIMLSLQADFQMRSLNLLGLIPVTVVAIPGSAFHHAGFCCS